LCKKIAAVPLESDKRNWGTNSLEKRVWPHSSDAAAKIPLYDCWFDLTAQTMPWNSSGCRPVSNSQGLFWPYGGQPGFSMPAAAPGTCPCGCSAHSGQSVPPSQVFAPTPPNAKPMPVSRIRMTHIAFRPNGFSMFNPPFIPPRSI
jgi:hypothetical protein